MEGGRGKRTRQEGNSRRDIRPRACSPLVPGWPTKPSQMRLYTSWSTSLLITRLCKVEERSFLYCRQQEAAEEAPFFFWRRRCGKDGKYIPPLQKEVLRPLFTQIQTASSSFCFVDPVGRKCLGVQTKRCARRTATNTPLLLVIYFLKRRNR